jgi:signal transduction histidine kinase
LEVGFWRPAAATYVDRDGYPVVRRPGTTTVVVERADEAVALVVFSDDRDLDEETHEAVVATALLTAEHAQREAEVAEQRRQVEESRRRLLSAADDERESVARQLATGPERRLRRLQDRLATAPTSPALAAAVDELRAAVQDLQLLGHGLHPAELERGLQAALGALADRAGLAVTTDVPGVELPPELAAAAYFTCAEGLANAVKHARATRAWMRVVTDGDVVRVEVADDGCGGAGKAVDGGLAGLLDRWEALGGKLQVTSPPGAGTRLIATAPLRPRPLTRSAARGR